MSGAFIACDFDRLLGRIDEGKQLLLPHIASHYLLDIIASTLLLVGATVDAECQHTLEECCCY